MKEIIKLTGITGETIYLRRDSYTITAIMSSSHGELKCTEIFDNGVVFRVKEPVEEVVRLIGWEGK